MNEDAAWQVLCIYEQVESIRGCVLEEAAACPDPIETIRLYAKAEAYRHILTCLGPLQEITRTPALAKNFPSVYPNCPGGTE